MNLAWREAQGAGELGDRLEQPTSDNVDGFAMPPQGRDRLDRSADHFLDVTFGEPCERRFIGTDNVEAFAVDFFERNVAVHRSLRQRCDLGLAAGTARQFVYALDAAERAVAVETDRIEFGG